MNFNFNQLEQPAIKKRASRELKRNRPSIKMPGDRDRQAQDEEKQVAQLLAASRTENGITHLLTQEDPAEIAWLASYLERVQKGTRHNKRLFQEASAFVDGAVIPREVAAKVSQFLGGRNKIDEGYQRKIERPFNLVTITKALKCSRKEAANLVGFVVFFNGKYQLETVLDGYKEKKFDHLNDLGVTEEDAESVASILKDEETVNRLTEKMFQNTVPLLVEQMTAGAVLNFVAKVRLFHKKFNQRLVQKHFATPERKKDCYHELVVGATKELDRTLYEPLESFEYLFGELTKAEFLKIFPNWREATPCFTRKYIERYGLELPEEKPKPVEKPPEPPARKVVRVPEKRMLELKEEEKEASGAATRLFPLTVKKEKAGKTDGREDKPEKPWPKRPEEEIIVVPFERDVNKHRDVIHAATDEMERAENNSERTKIFLGKIWPQFLVARAEGIEGAVLAEDVRMAASSLPDSVAEHFNNLASFTDNVSNHILAITETAAALRQDKELHDMGVYIRAEVIRRWRRTGKKTEPVELLSSLSFEIDERKPYLVGQEPRQTEAEILYLGQRLDQIDEEINALGFSYNGDTHGVVLTENIREATNEGVIPYLNDGTELVVGEDEEIHSLHFLTQQALSAEHPRNPNKQQRDAIFADRFRSTEDHELQHVKDALEGTLDEIYDPVQKRVAQETNAYLASIAAPSVAEGEAAPLTDLVKIINLYVSRRENPLSVLSDMFGIYKQASERSLILLSEKLSAKKLSKKDFRKNHLDSCAIVLGSVLAVSGEQLRQIAQEILADLRGVPVLPEAVEVKPAPSFVEASKGLPEAFQEKEVVKKKKPSALRANARQVIYLLALATLAGVVEPDKSGQANGLSDIISVDDAEMEEEIESVPSPLGSSKEELEKEKQVAVKSFKRGLWGYAEYLINQNVEGPFKKEQLNLMVADVTNNFIKLIQEKGSFGINAQSTEAEIEKWSKKITPKKAEKIIEFLQQSSLW